MPLLDRSRDFSGCATVIAAVGFLFILYYFIVYFPSYYEGRGRAAVSRARSDMRAVGLALESYHADNGRYPLPDGDPFHAGGEGSGVPAAVLEYALTSPVAYLKSLPADPFRKDKSAPRSFAYWAMPDNTSWILLTPGPNREFEIDLETLEKRYRPAPKGPLHGLLSCTYDPTNGSISQGDIWRYKE